jgi:molybdopterin-containing oxidoreductase family membrane subunit
MAESVMDSTAVLDAPLVTGKVALQTSPNVCGIVERKPPRAWYIAISISGTFTLILGAMLAYLVATGIGVWGNNQPIGWAWDITNFVFWIGIGHAGTLISAILFLLRQRWRTSINRAAEAMTLFAVMCAGIFTLVHVGRLAITGFFRYRTRTWASGPTSAARCCGTCSR